MTTGYEGYQTHTPFRANFEPCKGYVHFVMAKVASSLGVSLRALTAPPLSQEAWWKSE